MSDRPRGDECECFEPADSVDGDCPVHGRFLTDRVKAPTCSVHGAARDELYDCVKCKQHTASVENAGARLNFTCASCDHTWWADQTY